MSSRSERAADMLDSHWPYNNSYPLPAHIRQVVIDIMTGFAGVEVARAGFPAFRKVQQEENGT